jgi:hypothetical protein
LQGTSTSARSQFQSTPLSLSLSLCIQQPAERVSHSARPGAVWGGNAPTACQRERRRKHFVLHQTSQLQSYIFVKSHLVIVVCRTPHRTEEKLRSAQLNSVERKVLLRKQEFFFFTAQHQKCFSCALYQVVVAAYIFNCIPNYAYGVVSGRKKL